MIVYNVNIQIIVVIAIFFQTQSKLWIKLFTYTYEIFVFHIMVVDTIFKSVECEVYTIQKLVDLSVFSTFTDANQWIHFTFEDIDRETDSLSLICVRIHYLENFVCFWCDVWTKSFLVLAFLAFIYFQSFIDEIL